MSDDPNEFRVTDIRWVNDIPVPEGYEFLPVDSMPGPKIMFEAKLGPIDLGGDSGIIAKAEGTPPVVTPIRRFRKVSWKELTPEQQQDIQASGEAFDRFMNEMMESHFTDRLFFWTSSRGDQWEKIESDSAETAAIIQAERWNQKGYRGPFTIMVSVSGLEQPPTQGDKVTTFDLVPEVIFRAHKLEFKKLD